jgi:hypothetical protein
LVILQRTGGEILGKGEALISYIARSLLTGFSSKKIKRGEAPLRNYLSSPLHTRRGIKGEG